MERKTNRKLTQLRGLAEKLRKVDRSVPLHNIPGTTLGFLPTSPTLTLPIPFPVLFSLRFVVTSAARFLFLGFLGSSIDG